MTSYQKVIKYYPLILFWIGGIPQVHGQPDSFPNDLFGSEELFTITLRGEMRKLLNDRSGEPTYFPLELSFADANQGTVEIPVKVRTRGHFRRLRENCTYPPLLINFKKGGPQENTIFARQDKLKLIMPCRDDKLVIQEFLAYKIYNLITPYSFRARLVNVTLQPTDKKKESSFYGVLLEEEKQMAARNQMISIEKDLRPQMVQRDYFLPMAMFEYLIGNTDWSVNYLQNIKLIAQDSNSVPIAVPYDFDHSGMVNAPYAHPAPELKLASIRDRRYRGYCIPLMEAYDPVIKRFESLKPSIYAIYQDSPLLDDAARKSALRFLDDFYAILQHPEQLEKDLMYPCDPKGTGNVIIRGLREN